MRPAPGAVGLAAAGAVGVGTVLSFGLVGSPSAHSTGTIRTAAFTLVSNPDGTATLTVNPKVLLEPRKLQSDLARDGIPAMVTVGSFCSTDPARPVSSRSCLSLGARPIPARSRP